MFKSVDIIKRALQEPRDLTDAITNDNKLQGLLIEKQFFKLLGGEFTNSNGYDGIINGKKYEIKYTNYIMPVGYLRIHKCNYNKKGLFDYMTIIDGLHDMAFRVPHDVWYARGDFCGSEFHWSGTYNKYDRQKISNTKLLLEHQVYPKQKA
tara:strand:- start:307 stop:759 length:453 start_codon:yes stop_codon:yes gene_type:complete